MLHYIMLHYITLCYAMLHYVMESNHIYNVFSYNQVSLFQLVLPQDCYGAPHRDQQRPILDWTDENGLLEHFCKWKKKMQILFRGPLNSANDAIKCNYIIYCSGKNGMELVNKWETEGKITDTNHNQIDWYFELFEEHISPNSNTLIAIVELKRLFQSTMSLEDFHTKALQLVKEAKYPKGDVWNWVLRDTIISSLTSDKICAKVIKEGKDVTLTSVMEIMCLEVSTQWHLNRMQETAKVNYIQYGRRSKTKSRLKTKPSSSSGSSGSSGARPKLENTSKSTKLTGKGKKPLLLTNVCWRCGTSRHQKKNHSKALEAVCRGCRTKGHYEKVCMKKSAHLVGVLDSSTSSDTEYFDKHGQPIYAHMHMVHTADINKKKHLIQFPISVSLEKVRKQVEGPCPTVMLKADMGADVNLLNSSTFNKIIGDRSLLQPLTLWMEAYGNSMVSILRKFYAFLRWNGRIYKQLFYVTTVNASPNLLSRDGCYTLGVLKPCYSVETSKTSKHSSSGPTTDSDLAQWHNRTSEEKLSHSMQWSLYKEQLQGLPLKKQDILRVYSDVFTRTGKFPGPLYKFQLKPNTKPARHTPRWVLIHPQEAFHKAIRNVECLGIHEPVKEVTEWVNSFIIVEKAPADPNTEDQSPQKLRICLDRRDLNEALEWEPYYTRIIEEILTKFHGMMQFMIADFNKGFWMVELHPESQKLTTMAMDIWRFQCTRLLMGSIIV